MTNNPIEPLGPLPLIPIMQRPDFPSDHEVAVRLIDRLRRVRPKRPNRDIGPLWARVRDALAVGSTYAAAVCVKYGFDPDEEWMTPL